MLRTEPRCWSCRIGLSISKLSTCEDDSERLQDNGIRPPSTRSCRLAPLRADLRIRVSCRSQHSREGERLDTPVGRAVFLSYASQDTQAAQKICDALRAAGIDIRRCSSRSAAAPLSSKR